MRCGTLRYDAMRCSAEWCGAVWYAAVRCGAVRFRAVSCGAGRGGAGQYGARRCDGVRCFRRGALSRWAVRSDAMWCGAMRSGAVWCGADCGARLDTALMQTADFSVNVPFVGWRFMMRYKKSTLIRTKKSQVLTNADMYNLWICE